MQSPSSMYPWLITFVACLLGSLVLGGYCIHLARAGSPKPLTLAISAPQTPLVAESPPAPPAATPTASASAVGIDAFADDEAETKEAPAYGATRRAQRPGGVTSNVMRRVARAPIERSTADLLEVTTVARRYIHKAPAHRHAATTVMVPVIAYRAPRRSPGMA